MDIENDGHEPADETLLADQVDESTTADEGDEPGEAAAGDDEPEDKADAGDDAGDEDESEGDEDDNDEPPRRKKASGSERLKRRLERLEAENATLRSRAPSAGDVTMAEVRAEIGDPPREEDFAGDFAAYDRARLAYEVDARQTFRQLKARAGSAQAAEQARIREQVEAFREECEDFAREVPDFRSTLKAAEAKGLKASPTLERLIVESDQPAHLVYHLAKNPDRLDRLNRMSEREALRELGRIESRLTKPKPRTETKAPKPIVPPKGGAAAPADPSKMSFEQYRKWREGQSGRN